MNADEVIKALRNDSHFGCPVWHEKCTQLNETTADIIESLQAELAEYREAAKEYGIDAKTMLKLAKSQIKTAKMNNEILQALDDLEEYLIDEIDISRESKKREDETETGRAKALGRELAYCNCFDWVSEILDKGLKGE